MSALLVCFPLLLTVLVRVGWLTAFPTNPIAPIDAEGFHLLAANLLAGRGFAIGWEAPFCPTAVRTPLYPWFVAGVYTVLGRDPQRVVLAQVLLEVVTTAATMALTRAMVGVGAGGSRGGRRRAAMVAGVLYALNGTTQRFTGYLLSEALVLPLLTLAVVATVRLLRRPCARWSALAGLVWAGVLLVKPNAQYLAVGVALLVAAPGAADATNSLLDAPTRRRWGARGRIGLIFAGVLVAALCPWLLRNRLLVGRWTLSTAFDENVARVSAVATSAALQGLAAEPWSETWEHLYDILELQAVPELARVGSKASAPCDLQVDWQRRIAVAGRDLVMANPLTYAGVHARGVARSLLDPGHRLWYHVLTGSDWAKTGVVAAVWARIAWSLRRWAAGDALRALWLERVWRIPPIAGALWWGLLVGRLAIATVTVRGLGRLRRRVPVLLLLAGTIAYHLLLPGPIAHDRFYVPVVPVVVAIVGIGGISLWGSGGYNVPCAPTPSPHDTAVRGGHHDRGHA